MADFTSNEKQPCDEVKFVRRKSITFCIASSRVLNTLYGVPKGGFNVQVGLVERER